mmetsp:Transcript_609/g.1754  ORF Transcript_609/g.1754 Transcript_609/m.1754 type:complete len:374 (-) Transcript_609:599-1720(-)
MATQSIIRRAMSNLLVRRTVLVVSSPVCADRVFGSAAAATRKFGLTGSTQTFSISYTSAGSPLWQSPARRLSAAALPQPIDTESEDEAQSAGNRLSDRIGFIGAGNMGEAMMRGFTSSGVSSADRMSASVRSSERQKKMTSLGFRVFPDALKGGAEQLAANNDIIFLGVKPIYLGGVLKELAPFLEDRHLVISIAAGITLETLEGELPEGARVVRVMPNTPCSIGQAASTFAMGSNTTAQDQEKVELLMSSVGLAVCIDEHMMDAATGLAGSGPAYVFQMLEAMADGAVAAGLPREKALALAAQTVIGAAKMVFEASGDGSVTHPGVLKDRVASPGGTTIYGLAELESSGVRGAYIRAIRAAANRSAELSKGQ